MEGGQIGDSQANGPDSQLLKVSPKQSKTLDQQSSKKGETQNVINTSTIKTFESSDESSDSGQSAISDRDPIQYFLNKGYSMRDIALMHLSQVKTLHQDIEKLKELTEFQRKRYTMAVQ